MTQAMRRLLKDLISEGYCYSPRHSGGYRLPASKRNVRYTTLHSLRLLGLVERNDDHNYVLTADGRRAFAEGR